MNKSSDKSSIKSSIKSFKPRYFSAALISTLLLTGCTASKPQNEFTKWGFMDGIHSTRPQTKTPFIAILKLKTPALLETATRDQGKLAIDENQLKAIQTEQDVTIAELVKISPDVKILIRYKLVLNALTIMAPAEVFDQVASLPNVVMSEKSTAFARPKNQEAETAGLVAVNTSVKFIGSEAAYAQNIQGEGMKVGIIDTGIDYTHKMFLGEGTIDAYKAVDPAQTNAGFPNKKVVGGIDLVGTKYDSASPEFINRIPVPDLNPLDEAGHGTHVAGTVAGIGDGVNTYSGVAPAADLYAIKVFGADGSTSDEVVIAALEYAINPSGDLKFTDQLDVVNLSLGSGYGNPHIMYNQAISNVVRGGTSVVISAGNSGDKGYVVGAPGVSDNAIAVASSVDNMNQNIQFAAAEFSLAGETLNAEFVEGTITKPLKGIPAIAGEVIAVGVANVDFDQALKDQIKGKVALIDRGVVTFAEKIKRAQEAGAIAVVVANNADGEPIAMGGGEEKYDIPAIMIAKSAGALIKEKLQVGIVTVDLKSKALIEKPELIDTISSFSSRGPRSEDGLIKPEISSPGSNIISAGMGGGEKAAVMSGTSMAAPHIAGVMALLKQKFKDATPYELKSILMGHGKVIADKNKKIYTVSRQGAGRVQVAESLKARLVTLPAALSFGITDVEKQKTLSQEITLKNISAEILTLKPDWSGSTALQVVAPAVTLASGESKTISVTVKVIASKMQNANDELDGFLTFSTDKEIAVQVPTLVVARQISQIQGKFVLVHSTSAADSAGSVVNIEVQNVGINKGTAYLFNLLGEDTRKKDSKPDAAHNRNCDMQSAGYRVIEKDEARILQVAVKLFERMTTWNNCEVNVQIDSDGNGQADQEIAGTTADNLAGLSTEKFASLLLDSNKARDMRKQYEADVVHKVKDAKEDYTKALIDQQAMQVFDNSTLAIIEVDTAKLTLADTGELNIKISTTHQDSGVIEYDDYLGKQDQQWDKISINPLAQAFGELPEVVELAGQESLSIQAVKGYGSGDLILYVPQNRSVNDILLEDDQSQVIPVKFEN